jgi:hypothetical protein
MARKLRIVFSAACGVVCLFLIALWVRTKYAIDMICGPLSQPAGFGVMSRHGGIGLFLTEKNYAWGYYKYPADEVSRSEYEVQIGYKTALGFVQYVKNPGVFRIRVPYWSLVSLLAVLAAIPWLRWRFSLRTLLIITTLAAALLGAIVYAVR